MAGAIKTTKKPRKPKTTKQKLITHECIKTGMIDELFKDIHGNGSEGLKGSVLIINTNITHIKERMDELHGKYDKSIEETGTVKRAFETYQAEMIGAEKQQAKIDALEERKKVHRRWIIGLTITMVISLIGLIITVTKLAHDEGLLKRINPIENFGKK